LVYLSINAENKIGIIARIPNIKKVPELPNNLEFNDAGKIIIIINQEKK